MYSQYKTPLTRAFRNIKVKKPGFSKLVFFLIRLLGRGYLLFFLGIARIVLRKEHHLFEAFERALSGKSRCIIAFRHPVGGEPQILTWFFLFRLKSLAAKKGIRFAHRPHAVFVYGYEVVRWGGWVARFIMPNIGAMPIHHAKMDTKGMALIIKSIVEGPYPVALAPEGQVSYSTDSVPRLEPGVVRIGFQAVERLLESGKDCPVEILPVSVYFRFGSWGKLILEQLIRKMERICGIKGRERKKVPLLERMDQIRLHILEINEDRYCIARDVSVPFQERLDRVINAALETAERMMGIKGEGNFFPRMYRVRQLCWDRIFIPGVESFENISMLKRNTMDLQAGEAWYIARHVELIDLCWYFRIPIPAEDTVIDKKIEYAQNLWDFASRTMGGAFNDRVSIFPRRVIIQAGPVINLKERFPFYRENKKEAIAETMSDLEKAYLDCIAEANARKES